MADTQRLITTEDIQRRYDLKNLETNTKIIKTLDKQLTNTFGIIKEYIKYTTSLESKEQYFYDGTPTLENLPASEWEDMGDHINTLYYDSDAGKVYIFKYNEDDDYYYWEELNDSSLLNVMSTANSQADVSQDNLRRVFYEQPTAPYNVGDIWINGSKIYRCLRNETEDSQFYQEDWIDYTQYNDDIASSNALRILGSFKETVETEYATKALLESTENTITARVDTVETVAKSKNKVFTSEPTPPYYRGDSYIKEVTDQTTGITMNLIYVCQTTRETGTYHAEDFSLQPGYATTSQLRVTSDGLNSVVAKVGTDPLTQGTVVSNITSLTQRVTDIEAEIGEIADVTVSASTESAFIDAINLPNVETSEPILITIKPIIDNISLLYPSTGLYPSNSIYPKGNRILRFTNTSTNEVIPYEIPYDLLYYDAEHFDEFNLDYEKHICQIIKRCKYNSNGSVGLLDNEQVIPIEYPEIDLTEGNYQVDIPGYSRGYIFVRLMAINAYSAQYATKVELKSAITLTTQQINLEVSKKLTYLDENGNRTDEVISSINLAPGEIKINADRVNIQGVLTAINNDTTTTINGNKITTGSIDTAQLKANAITSDKIATNAITANKISAGTITADKIANATITGSKMVNGTITATQIADATITGSKIQNSTITGGKIASATIQASNIVDGTITGAKIAGGTITGAKIANSTITSTQIANATITGANIAKATITDANIANINASKITAGTISADKISGGTIGSSSISIGSSSYYLRMGANWTKHPEVSGLNVGAGGIDMNGHAIGKFGGCANSSSYSITSGTNLTLRGDNLLYLRGGSSSSSIMIYTSAGYKSMNSAYVARNPSDTTKTEEIVQIQGKSNAYIRLNASVLLRPNNGGGAYIWGLEDYNKILTKSGSPSTLSIKENVKKKDISNIPSILRQIDLYDYKYKEGIEGGIEDYGYIIDYLEKINGINEYFTFNDIERDGFKYKAINHEHLEKFLLGAVITLQKQIDELEEKYGKTINN